MAVDAVHRHLNHKRSLDGPFLLLRHVGSVVRPAIPYNSQFLKVPDGGAQQNVSLCGEKISPLHFLILRICLSTLNADILCFATIRRFPLGLRRQQVTGLFVHLPLR